MCGVERLGDLGEELDCAPGLERAVLGHDACARSVALDVAHGEEEQAVLISRLVDGDDVGVIERGGDPRLAQEALAEALVLGELGGDHLERDLASEPLLLGAVDRAHPPSADEGLDPVAGDRRSGRQHDPRRCSPSKCLPRTLQIATSAARKCNGGDIRNVAGANDTAALGFYSRVMTDRTREEHHMKRIAT